MSRKLEALAIRQYRLRQKIETQRNELDETAQHFKTFFTVADTGIKAVKFMHNHPALVTGGIAAIMSWRKIGFSAMALQGWRALYLYPSLLAYAAKYLNLPNRRNKEHTPTDTAI